MVICIDKATAVRMYDKVQAVWQAGMLELQSQHPKASPERRKFIEAIGGRFNHHWLVTELHPARHVDIGGVRSYPTYENQTSAGK
jgi:hypothetical protein